MTIGLLTIGILTCDNDIDKIAQCVARVQERVHIHHEVIVWDNTETKDLPSLEGVKVLSAGTWKENVRQFDARKGIAQKTAGDYVWFIDPDDDIAQIDETFIPHCDAQVDAIVFRHKEDGVSIGNGKGFVAATYKDFFHGGVISGGLWRKWFKKSALLQAYKLQHFDTRISFMEDDLLELLLVRQPRVVWQSTKAIYNYRCNTSVGGHKVITSGVEMSHYVTGLKSCIAIVQNVYSQQEQNDICQPLAGNFHDMVMGRMAKRLGDALVQNIDKAAELTAPLKDEVDIKDFLKCMTRQRPWVPLNNLKAWADAETAARRNLAAMAVKSLPVFCDTRGVSFMLNHQCNLHCAYCCQGRLQDTPPIDDDEMYRRFDKAITKLEGFGQKLKPGILGGEPTIWSDYLVRKLLARLARYDKFQLFTNGTNRKSLWYSAANCYRITHVTDWETHMVNYAYESDHDRPLIIVTHPMVERLEKYLKVNRCRSLMVDSATDSPTPGLDCTSEDNVYIAALVAQYGLTGGYTVNTALNNGDEEAKCTGCDLSWQADCSGDLGHPIMVTSCCKSEQAGYLPLEQWTPQFSPDCSGCLMAV